MTIPTAEKNATLNVLADVMIERDKQIEKWGNASDDNQVNGEIAQGAGAYCLDQRYLWPAAGEDSIWSPSGFKTKDEVGRRGQLIRACAMLVAEIERLDRKEKA